MVNEKRFARQGKNSRPRRRLPQIEAVRREADGRLLIVLRAVIAKALPGLGAFFLMGCLAPTASLRPPADFSRYSPKAVEVRGSSMSPLIPPGTKLAILQTYYASHPVRRGDVVAYAYAANRDLLVKRVRAVAGDRFGLRENRDCYELLVNGEVLRNSAGKKYCIAKASSARILLYARGYPILPKKTCLLLGELPGGSLDGSCFGLAGEQDLRGKVVLPPAGS